MGETNEKKKKENKKIKRGKKEKKAVVKYTNHTKKFTTHEFTTQ